MCIRQKQPLQTPSLYTLSTETFSLYVNWKALASADKTLINLQAEAIVHFSHQIHAHKKERWPFFTNLGLRFSVQFLPSHRRYELVDGSYDNLVWGCFLLKIKTTKTLRDLIKKNTPPKAAKRGHDLRRPIQSVWVWGERFCWSRRTNDTRDFEKA